MAGESPRVSVIVPMYEVEDYIGTCIESIVSQSVRNIEVILVDDGSPDASKQIADGYQISDSRIRVVSQTNAGVSAARNHGLNLAKGEYVCFVDGDDWIHPNFVAHMLEIADRYDAQIVISTRVLESKDSRDPTEPRIESWSPSRATAELLYPDIPLGSWNKLFSRRFLNENSIRFPTAFYMGEGLNFITQSTQLADRIVATDKRLYYYRRDNASSATTKKSIQKAINALQAIDYLRSTLIVKTKEVKVAADYHVWMTRVFALASVLAAGGRAAAPHLYDSCRRGIRRSSPRLLLRARVSGRRRAKLALSWFSPRMVSQIGRRGAAT